MAKHFGKVGMVVCFLAAVVVMGACSSSSDDDGTVILSSRSYSGHATDEDANNFVTVYPDALGTRLDDCKTCHRAGVAGTDTETIYNVCDYCHLLEFPDDRLETGVPETFEDTLNVYGLAYADEGRDRHALTRIQAADTDGDGYTNEAEIRELRYPGDADSRPDQPLAPTVAFSLVDIEAMPFHEQFMLMVTTKQQFDDYVTYGGITVADLLAAAGVDLNGAEGITVFAPDGFGKDFSMAEIEQQFPNGIFYQTPSFDDPDKELVNYPDPLPASYQDGDEIDGILRLMLAYTRDGVLLDTAYYDGESGRLTGEGPFRLVIPQAVPSRPDRGKSYGPYHDGWDYDPDIDHNAGSCVRGACVIRVNPMPDGYEEFDWKNGWSLIEEGRVVIYGHGVAAGR
jgi:hypothetical protein